MNKKFLLLVTALFFYQNLAGMQGVEDFIQGVGNLLKDDVIDIRQAIVAHNFDVFQSIQFMSPNTRNDLDEYGMHLIHYVAAAGFDDGLKELITMGTDVNERDKQFKTPLHHAVLWRQHATVKLLLEDYKADVNAQDKQWRRPMFYAAMVGDEKMIELLVAHNAKVTAADKFGLNFLHVAALRGHVGVVRFLAPLISVDQEDKSGETALCKAAGNNYPDVMYALVEHKAAVNRANAKGRTALHGATQKDHLASVIVLLRLGADPYAKDNDGITPYALASADMRRLIKEFVQTKKKAKQQQQDVQSLQGTIQKMSLLS